MQWFKHYSSASDSVKLNQLIDELGVEGYGRYWLLLEMLAAEYDGESTEFEVHFRKISAKVQIKFSKKLETFLQKLSDFSLIGFRVAGKVYFLQAPILAELKNRDFKKARQDRGGSAPKNKIKNKNKIKSKIKSEVPDSQNSENEKFNIPDAEFSDDCNLKPFLNPRLVVELWNQNFSETLGHCHGLGGGVHRSNFITASGYLKNLEDWQQLFDKCKDSDYLMGKIKNWKVSLIWLVDYDNALKVLNGSFENSNGLTSTECDLESIELD